MNDPGDVFFRDPLVELEKVQKKVRAYYQANPGADKLPDDLARELTERTRDYVDYQEQRRQPIT